ncbi:MAG: hypothetical protein GC154_16570 [bacterium]|nr:hypothetical protein [bacterium]
MQSKLQTLLILLLGVGLAVCLGFLGYFYTRLQEAEMREDVPVPKEILEARATPQEETARMDLLQVYFPTREHNMLASVSIQSLPSDTLTQRIRSAMELLIRGPREENLLAPIPEGTKLQNVYWSESDGRVYVSFSPELLGEDRPMHGLAEWATIYSIVNTAAQQSSAVKDVQILVNGEIIDSGRLVWDWSMPFKPDKSFVQYPVGSQS